MLSSKIKDYYLTLEFEKPIDMMDVNILKRSKLKIGVGFKLLIVAVFVLSSCGNFENIEIGEPENTKVQGFEDNFLLVNLSVPVNNPTIHKIKIMDFDVQVFLNGKYIGKLLLDEKLVIKGKRNAVYDLPIKVRLNNLLGAAFIMMNMKKGQNVEVKLEGEVVAKSFLIKKTIQLNETRRFVM